MLRKQNTNVGHISKSRQLPRINKVTNYAYCSAGSFFCFVSCNGDVDVLASLIAIQIMPLGGLLFCGAESLTRCLVASKRKRKTGILSVENEIDGFELWFI